MILIIATLVTAIIAAFEAYFDAKKIKAKKPINHTKSFLMRCWGLIPFTIYLVYLLPFDSFAVGAESFIIILHILWYIAGIYWVVFEHNLYMRLGLDFTYMSKNKIDRMLGNKWIKVMAKIASIVLPLYVYSIL